MPAPTTYTLLDFGHNKRLEQWGPYRLIRPDPAATGRPAADPDLWQSADATYEGEKGKGHWQTRTALPKEWPVDFDDLRLLARLAPYKHTGVFPEQQQNWQWSRPQLTTQKRDGNEPLKVLNLFAYTGGATIALAKSGAVVTHVDASKPAIAWAKSNAALNAIPHDRTRWILDDAPAFVARERRRNKTYDAILLDPPAFGHSPTGKAWRVDRDLPPLLKDCCALLSEKPLFLILNAYARNETPENLRDLLTEIVSAGSPRTRPQIESHDLRLATADRRTLSTGIVARCTFC